MRRLSNNSLNEIIDSVAPKEPRKINPQEQMEAMERLSKGKNL